MAVRATQETLLISSRGASHVRSTQEVLLISVPTMPTTSFPILPPTISGLGPQDFTMALENVVGESVSPFTLSEQEQLWPGDMFTIEANLPPMLYQQAEQWIAFLNGLYGKYGTFLMGDYNRPTPQGPMSGAPVVNGAIASGSNQLLIRGASVGVTNWAVAGDYVQVTATGGLQRMHKVLQNANTDAGGHATLQVRP